MKFKKIEKMKFDKNEIWKHEMWKNEIWNINEIGKNEKKKEIWN
jgi:hypothetical protein